MLAAGHSKGQDRPTPRVKTQSILPYAWIHTYKIPKRDGTAKRKEDRRGGKGEYVLRCG